MTRWGKVVAQSGATSIFQFNGQYVDGESGFVFLRARYYDPLTGQFISHDPLFMATLDGYGYAGNDPYNNTDPLGLYCVLGKNPNGSCRGSGVLKQTRDFVEDHWVEIVIIAGVACLMYTPCAIGALQLLNGLSPTATAWILTASGALPVAVSANPSNWSMRVANNGQGVVIQQSSSGNALTMRIMNATSRYAHGYVVFTNKFGQPIGLDGKPGPPGVTHIPIAPDGSFPIPVGWP